MSLVNLANVCSHLQNASKARLGLTSVPSSNLILSLTLALQNAGFLSSVTRAGPTPPEQLYTTSLSHTTNQDLLDPTHPDTAIVTQENVSSRRLWLGLKYWKEEPVLSRMIMESRPKQRIHVGWRELDMVVHGRTKSYIKGLSHIGECMFVSTDHGVMEAREAVEKKLGGLVLCRAW
ncbi:MAG: hypothetical protein Q9162_000189 [Coniocarpon cinnabarinum]